MKTIMAILATLIIAATAWAEGPFMTSDPDPNAQVFQCKTDGVFDEQVYPVVEFKVRYDLATMTSGEHSLLCRFGAYWMDNGQASEVIEWTDWSEPRPFGRPKSSGGCTLTGIIK